MYTLIVVTLLSGGFETVHFHDFSSQALCEAAKSQVVAMSTVVGAHTGVYDAVCVAK
jgi:hypothetical protein